MSISSPDNILHLTRNADTSYQLMLPWHEHRPCPLGRSKFD
jgi:hypothetical protein